MVSNKLHKAQSVFLIGPMGAGKSSIGRYLADALDREFYDSDEEIERRAGADLAWIFDLEGEAGFRERERKVIAELTEMPGIVLATGGGAVLNAESRQLLTGRGLVVYLQVSVDEQLQRTERDKRRPSLREVHREDFFKEMQEVRLPLYQAMADLTFMTDANSVKAVTKQILNYLQQKD